jgi:hypothetical protein
MMSVGMLSFENVFFIAFSAYLVVILLMTAVSVYYLLKTLRGGDFALPDSELFKKAGKVVGKSFKDRGLTLHDLLWALELRGAVKVDSQSSKYYSTRPLKVNPEHLESYISAFLIAMNIRSDVTVKNESLIISIN